VLTNITTTLDNNEIYRRHHKMKMRYRYLQKHQNDVPELYDQKRINKNDMNRYEDLPMMEEEVTHQTIQIRTTTTLKTLIMEA